MADNEAHYEIELPAFDKSPKVLVVLSPYYKIIADNLLEGAVSTLEAAGAFHEVVHVPGALEITPAIRIAHRQADFDGYVALGCVVRGETSHYETVCNDSSRGILFMGLEGANIGNGILTVENMEQAEVRADPKGQNKGGGAAAAALHLISLERKYSRPAKGVGFRAPGETILMAGKPEGSETT